MQEGAEREKERWERTGEMGENGRERGIYHVVVDALDQATWGRDP